MKKIFCASVLPAIILGLLAPSVSHGSMGQDRGGGDDVGLEFQSAFITALRTIQTRDSGLAKKIHDLDATSVLVGAHILAVDSDLKVTSNGVTQDSVATNQPSTETILVNRSRWHAIQNPIIKQGIALHEILSLRGIEWTGQYPISSQFVAYTGLRSDVVVSGGLRYNSPIEVIRNSEAYDAARSCQAKTSKAHLQQVVSTAEAAIDRAITLCNTTDIRDQYKPIYNTLVASQTAVLEIDGCLINSTIAKVKMDLIDAKIRLSECAFSGGR